MFPGFEKGFLADEKTDKGKSLESSKKPGQLSIGDQQLAFMGIDPKKYEVALGKLKEDRSIPLENLKDAESAGKRELLRDAQMNIWEGHLNEEEVADLMRTGEVIFSETLLDGHTKPKKITLDSGIIGVFKTDDEDYPIGWLKRTPEDDRWFSYQLEIAAFQMDKKLELGMVPLTVERKMNGKKGSFQLWVNDLKSFSSSSDSASSDSSSSDSSSSDSSSSDSASSNSSSSDSASSDSSSSDRLPDNAQFFDFLIHHQDRFDRGNGMGYRNAGYTPNRKLVLYDNEVAFSPAMSLYLKDKDISKLVPDPHILKNAEKLNMEELEDIKYLTPKRKQALLHRRDLLVQEIHKYQVKQEGDKMILHQTS